MIQRSINLHASENLLQDQKCITPKGSGVVCGIRYCEILKRIRVSVILDVEVDGKKYHVFDRYAVKPLQGVYTPVKAEIEKAPAIKFGATDAGVKWQKRRK